MSCLRHTGAAHSVRGQRDELLRALSDRWSSARRPRDVATPQARLAANARGARSMTNAAIAGVGSQVASERSLLDQAFSRAAGGPLVTGNSVRLLRDAAENYPAWLD